MAPPQSLVWITEQPQGLRRVGQAPHPGVDPGAEGQGTVLLRIVEGDAFLQVGASAGPPRPAKASSPRAQNGLRGGAPGHGPAGPG